jgi:hypothetical protein
MENQGDIASKMFPGFEGSSQSPVNAQSTQDSRAETAATLDELAGKLFPENAAGPDDFQFEIPEDLQHLNLQHNPVATANYTKLARSVGLNQVQAQQLLNHHLRAIHGKK